MFPTLHSSKQFIKLVVQIYRESSLCSSKKHDDTMFHSRVGVLHVTVNRLQSKKVVAEVLTIVYSPFYCVVFSTEEDHRSAVETFGGGKTLLRFLS